MDDLGIAVIKCCILAMAVIFAVYRLWDVGGGLSGKASKAR